MTLLLLYKENPKFLIPQTLAGGMAPAAAAFSVAASLAMPGSSGPRDSAAVAQETVQEAFPAARTGAGGTMTSATAATAQASAARDGIARPAAGATSAAPVPVPQARGPERAPEIVAGGFLATLPVPQARAGERAPGAPGEALAGVSLPVAVGRAPSPGVAFSYGQTTLALPQARRSENAPGPVFSFGFFFSMPAARRSERQIPPPATVSVVGTVSANLPQARGLERGSAAVSGAVFLDLSPARASQAPPAASASGHVVTHAFARAIDPGRAPAPSQFGPAVYFTFPAAPGPREGFALARYVIRAFGARVYVEVEEMPRAEIDVDDGVSG